MDDTDTNDACKFRYRCPYCSEALAIVSAEEFDFWWEASKALVDHIFDEHDETGLPEGVKAKDCIT